MLYPFLLIIELFLDDFLLRVLEDDSVKFDDRLGLWDARPVFLVGPGLLEIVS